MALESKSILLVRPGSSKASGGGLEDAAAGRTQPIAEAFADIRRDLNLPKEP
jgi:hypothetical protein